MLKFIGVIKVKGLVANATELITRLERLPTVIKENEIMSMCIIIENNTIEPIHCEAVTKLKEMLPELNIIFATPEQYANLT